MFLTKQQLNIACNLSTWQVEGACMNAGRTRELDEVKFIGMTADGKFVYAAKPTGAADWAETIKLQHKLNNQVSSYILTEVTNGVV